MAVKYKTQPSRAASARELTQQRRTYEADQPNNVLAAPRLKNPEQHFRWVREQIRGEPDPLSVATALRDGFRPVRMEDLDETDTFRIASEIIQGSGTGTVRYGGLIGMVFDETLNQRRREAAQRGVDKSTTSAQAVFGMEQQVGVDRGGLPVFHEDRGSHVATGAAADPSLGAT